MADTHPPFVRPWHPAYPDSLEAAASYPAIALWELLAQSAERDPNATALVAGSTRYNYGELWKRVLACAATLSSTTLGTSAEAENAPQPRPGDRILLCLPNSLEFVVYFYGALRAGCIVSAANPHHSPEELAAQIADADPRLLVAPATMAEHIYQAVAHAKARQLAIRLLDPATAGLDDPTLLNTIFDPPCLPCVPQRDVAVLQYTSGTTGRAKGAMMSHRNLVANALQNARWFGWQASDINLAVVPLFHSWGMCCCMNSTFAVGATLVISEQGEHFDPARVLSELAQHHATILYGSATMIHRLLEHADKRSAREMGILALRHVKAGAMLSQGNLKQRWDSFCPDAPMRQGYGLTEASPESHNNPPQRHKAGTVGVPIQDTDCRIVDLDDPTRVLGVGEQGEVCLRGPQVTLGYWNNPEATRAAFADGWLRTGDIGCMDQEGYLTIVDRAKDLIKFRGYSISPGTVEDCLLAHPMVKEVAVVGMRHEVDGEHPTAFVVLREQADEAAWQLLREHCRRHLAPYEVPRAFRAIESIPRNRMGKPLRRMLRDG